MDIDQFYLLLIRKNCFGCVNNCLSQKDHDICLYFNEYYYLLAEKYYREWLKRCY